MTRFIPPLLLLLFGAWCGTFLGSASSWGSTAGILALLGTLAVVGSPWEDPLRLGRFGRLLPLALWLVVGASAYLSPVSRAGRMAFLMLPAFLLLPGAVARCWSREEDRRPGLRAVTVLVIGVSLWALIDYEVRDLPRVAMPLGQHNLLASWLVVLLPLALLTAREPGLWRWLGLLGGLLPAITILATLSLAGNLALAAEAFLALVWLARSRRSPWSIGLLVLLVLISVGGLISQRARIASIVAGQDLSVQGRSVYYEGAWEGFQARPILGWGPGSAAWTASAFFDPRPGVSPWGESVGELHSLPLHLAYELGAVGLTIAVLMGGVFFARRLSGQSTDPALLSAGLLGLCGAAVASLGSAAFAVTALPVAVAVTAGATLSTRPETSGGSRTPVLVYVIAAVVGLIPLEAARWSYDRAVTSRPEDARAALDRAVRFDPSFPLYRMRLALLENEAELARQAARDARSVATLWTVAGILGSSGASAGSPWAGEALETACALDPFNPFPPFYRMAGEENPRDGAHALLAEPRLAAATFWERHPELFQQTVAELKTWPKVDAGWKEGLLAALPLPLDRQGETGRLSLEIDTVPDLALSLHTFRRRPFPVQWPLIEVRLPPLERLQIPPATTLRGSEFTGSCGARGRSPEGHHLRNR